ncbi:MAG: hypothetical protein HEQ20_19605 [Aphanizomenon flos-aquae KM1D3_PB]|nr:MAG: hypothetical protein HEQ20_19605 [Aphanizomenon flos-aquae KM1D3_PB]
MYYDVGDSEALLQAVRIKIEFLAPRVVQAKFREIAKTITKPRFSIFLAISRTPKKMSEPGVTMCYSIIHPLENSDRKPV